MIGALQGFIIGIGGVAVTLGITMLILANVSTAEGLNNTTAGTNVASINTSLGGAVMWIGLLILVVFAVAVLVYFTQSMRGVR